MYGSFAVDAIPRTAANCQVSPSVLAQVNGSFNDTSPIRLASFTDGLSTTAMVAEHALWPLRDIADTGGSASDRFGWLVTGNWGDTLVTAFYPPNMYRKVSTGGDVEQFSAASSLHPGGLNVLMGDGSVTFIKESISTWPFDPSSGLPVGVVATPSGSWTNVPSPGVWQALATRNGAELVTADGF